MSTTRTTSNQRPAASRKPAPARPSTIAQAEQPSPPGRPAADPLRADARDRAADNLAPAEDIAGTLHARTDSDADHLIRDAQQRAAKIQGDSERLHCAAGDEAASLTRTAEDQATRILADAALAQALEDTAALHGRATDQAQADADRLLEDAASRAGGIIADAERLAERIIGDTSEQAEQLITAAQAAARTARRAADADLAAVTEELLYTTEQLERTRTRVGRYQTTAENELAERRVRADQACRDAVIRADVARAQAAEDAETIRAVAADRAKEILEKAEQQASDTRREAEVLRERLEETARTDADCIREDAQEEARRLRGEAEALVAEQARLATTARGDAEAEAERTVNAATHEAQRILAEAEARAAEVWEQVGAADAQVSALQAERARREVAEAARRQSRIRRAWRLSQAQLPAFLRTTVLCAGILFTAQREHQLAMMAGADEILAWLLAVCVDAWVLAATRSKVYQETLTALGVMLLCQVAAILCDLHLLGVEPDGDGGWRVQWGIAVPLAMVVPVVIWRVHALMDHASDTHDRKAARGGEQATPTDAPANAHHDSAPLPSQSGPPFSDAHDVLLPAQNSHGQRSPAREITPGGGASNAPPSLPPAQGWTVPAHDIETMSAEALSLLRQAVARPLYDDLDTRPTASQIHAALMARGLANQATSRSTVQRVRDAIESREPHLAKPRAVRST
ncbi:hypothetical protein AB0K43_22105 [Kitasatospora sp. NPDC049258]|uniref:hypothetical protein n=1 Tax=Kitasatospora sp. NPDC049258 TaxID=3155394 RepID=UPI003428A3B6